MWKYKGMKVKKIYMLYNVTFMYFTFEKLFCCTPWHHVPYNTKIGRWALMEKKTYKES